VNYAVNYDYIVKNLCENRNIPQSTCKGKCYVEKELAKTEKQTTPQNIKISGIDVFLSNEVLSFSGNMVSDLFVKTPNSSYQNLHTSEYFSRIFHPPLA
jgi:D-lyxose ketol-isomerase